MSQALVLITFLSVTVLLAVLAKRLRIPFPIAFVIGGILMSFARNVPRPNPDPELIILLVVPPLLFGAAWQTDWFDLRRNARPITLYAVGLVLVTMAAVGAVVHFTLPEFTWPLAFTLGAIVSPPDAVAAEAILERLAIPHRIVAIITGESLVNDATALVLYRFALAAAVTGSFALGRAGVAFVVVAAGGTLVGILIALLLEGVLRYIMRVGYGDPLIVSVVLLLAPFAAYLAGEELHVSGVLAAVSAGIVLSRRSPSFLDSESRVLAMSVWRLLIFVLNAFAFLLIGLELPSILLALVPHVRDYVLYGLLLSVTVIVVRLSWVFPAAYIPRMLSRRLRERDPIPSWRQLVVLGWSGMRGIISLAIALALPYTLGDAAFPQRSELIFLTFCVVFVTLVFQGLTLGPLIEWLGVTETSRSSKREANLRIRALEAGVAKLREEEAHRATPVDREVIDRILGEYMQRINVLHGREVNPDADEAKEIRLDRSMQKEALAAERQAIAEMRRAGEIPDEIYRSIEYDLDLATLRLS
jgi:CPA1 family monovalent cation:H+ antiporter